MKKTFLHTCIALISLSLFTVTELKGQLPYTPLLLSDINPGTGSSAPDDFSYDASDSIIYFTAVSASNGRQVYLYETETNSADCITCISGFNTNAVTSAIPIFHTFGVALFPYFEFVSFLNQHMMLRSANTDIAEMSMLNQYGGNSNGSVAELNHQIIFNGRALDNPDPTDFELMSYDSTGGTFGVHLIKAFNLGFVSSIGNMVRSGNFVYFMDANQIWRTDGTTAGTQFCENINLVSTGDGYRLTPIGNKLIYAADSFYVGEFGYTGVDYQLRSYDVVTHEDQRLQVFSYLDQASTAVYNNRLYFVSNETEQVQVNDSTSETVEHRNLYSTDGTVAGTHLEFQEDNTYAALPKVLDDTLYFSTGNTATNNLQIWKITSAGAELVEDHFAGLDYAIFEGDLYFTAYTFPDQTFQLRRKVGNQPSEFIATMRTPDLSAISENLFNDGKNLYFGAYDTDHGLELNRLFTGTYHITTEVFESTKHDSTHYFPGGGTITPETDSVAGNEDVTFTITPSNCNVIHDIDLDGDSVANASTGNTFVLSNVTSDHHIAVYFRNNDTIAPEITSVCAGNMIISPDTEANQEVHKYGRIILPELSATDNCTNPVLTIQHFRDVPPNEVQRELEGDTFFIGRTKVLNIASDDAKNADTCSTLITVCPKVLVVLGTPKLTCTGIKQTLYRDHQIIDQVDFAHDFGDATFTFNNYQWYKNGHIMLGQTLDSVHISKSATYALRVTGSGCDVTSPEYVIKPPTLSINGGITSKTKCTTEPYVLGVNDSILALPAQGFQWFEAPLNSNSFELIDGLHVAAFITNSEGKYYCIVTLAGGCAQKKTNTLKLKNKNNLCGLKLDENIEESEGAVKLFPNPTTGNFAIQFNEPILSPALVQVYDLTGKLIATNSIPQQTEQWKMDLSSAVEGMYLVKIVNNELNETLRINVTQ